MVGWFLLEAGVVPGLQPFMEDCMRPKKKQSIDNDPLGDDVALAYVMTTDPQRAQVAEDWILGDRVKHKRFGDLLGINPDGLLIAALLDAEHESICFPTGRPRRNRYGDLLKLAMSYRGDVDNPEKPVNNSAETVDNSEKPVDNSVEKTRQLSTGEEISTAGVEFYPQGESYTQTYPQEDVDKSRVNFSRELAGSGYLSTLSTPPTATTNPDISK